MLMICHSRMRFDAGFSKMNLALYVYFPREVYTALSSDAPASTCPLPAARSDVTLPAQSTVHAMSRLLNRAQ